MWKKLLIQCYCNSDKNAVIDTISPESGYDRVKRLYSQDQYGMINPQMYYLVHNVSSSMVVIFFFGAMVHMVKTKDDYFRRNVASTYESQYLARVCFSGESKFHILINKSSFIQGLPGVHLHQDSLEERVKHMRKLTDTVTLNGFKGGAKFAFKYGTFSSLYLLCTTTAANYNNKITIYEHIGSGALLGALARFRFGLKGMAAAASLGGILGAIAGGSILTYMWFADIKFQDIIADQNNNYYAMRKEIPAHRF